MFLSKVRGIAKLPPLIYINQAAISFPSVEAVKAIAEPKIMYLNFSLIIPLASSPPIIVDIPAIESIRISIASVTGWSALQSLNN